MHIMEGFLPPIWSVTWFAVSLPVIALGIRRLNRMVKDDPQTKSLLAVCGGFAFVLSSLKLPSVAGSSSHPTGTGMSAIFFGPSITAVLALIVLIYQALFLAHGGLTTLGANVFSMGIAGPFVGYMVYKGCLKIKLGFFPSVFLAAALCDLSTYLVTSMQLALAFPAAQTDVLGSFKVFAGVFAITQVPLALAEGLVTSMMIRYVVQIRVDILHRLRTIAPEGS